MTLSFDLHWYSALNSLSTENLFQTSGSAHTIILVFHILVENLGRETKIAEHVSDQNMFYFYEAVSFFPVQFSLFLANRLQVSFHDNPYKLLGNYDIEHCHYKNEGLAAAVLRG